MPTDFTAYTDPGIYIEMIDPPVNRTSAITPTVVALIGAAGSEGRELVESATISSQSATTLTNKGIKPYSLVVKNRLSLEQYTSAAFGTVLSDVPASTALTSVVVKKKDEGFSLPSGVVNADYSDSDVLFEIRINNQTYGVTGVTVSNDTYTFDIASTASIAISAGQLVNLVAPYVTPIKVGTLNATALASQSNLSSSTSEFRIQQNVNSIQRVRIADGENDVEVTHGSTADTLHFTVTIPSTTTNAFDIYDQIFNGTANTVLGSAYEDKVAVIRTVVESGYVDYTFVMGFTSPFLLETDNVNTTITAVGLMVNDRILVDKERIEIEGLSLISTDGSDQIVELSVLRGRDGTAAVGHGKRDVYWASGYDYYVNNDLGEIESGSDDITILNAVSGGRLAPLNSEGNVVTSSERVEISAYSSDAGQFTVESFTDLDNIRSKYGSPIAISNNGTLGINSNLTLAAQLALRNGASQVYCINVGTNDFEGFSEAIDKLAGFDEINTIVPITIGLSETDTVSVFNKLRQFCTEQANLGNLLRAFVAVDGNAIAWSAPDYISVAQSIASSRISLVAPSLFTLQTSSGKISAGGPFVAAALAGLQASLGAQIPLTRKELDRSVYSIEDTFTRTEMLQLQSGGVLVLFQDRNGMVAVRHGLTTDMSSVYSQEVSVVTARDRLRDLFYDSLETSGILGSPITTNTQELVVSNVIGALEFAKRATLIFDYADVKYRIPTSNPTAIEIRFAYRPTMPLNYVLVQFSVDTSNSSVTFQSVTEGGV